jgi:hypothetical protein
MGRGPRDGAGLGPLGRGALSRAAGAAPRRLAWLGAAAAAAVAAGCYRVEYHRRPFAAALGELPPSVTLDDGTVVVYGEHATGAGLRPPREGAEPRRIREEREDGTVVLSAWMPQDVLANMLMCLRNREYELFWEQMVSQQTKAESGRAGQGETEFGQWCERHRSELGATLTRMLMGLTRNEAIFENLGGGVIRCRLYPGIASQFAFTRADVISEPAGVRLLSIR